MVHVLDATTVANRAVAAAERLGQLAPLSPHLLHMPAHTYINTGRFDDAVKVNEAALAADTKLAEAEKAQGFTPSKDWRGHNTQFLWYAAIVAGQEKVALDAADSFALRMKDRDDNFAEYARSLRLITLVRFERWDTVMKEPKPAGDKGVAQTWWLFARGVAQARTNHAGDAAATWEQLKPVAAQVREKNAKRAKTVAMMDYATARLESEVASARSDSAAAIAAQGKAADAAVTLDDSEPPMMADMARVDLGNLQARSRHWADAEASFRRALADRPGHPLAQRGLREALAAQGKT